MELALSLGDAPRPFSFLAKAGSRRNQPPSSSSDPPVQLDLLPFSPVPKSHPSPDKLPPSWLNERLPGRTGPETRFSNFRKQRRDFDDDDEHDDEENGAVGKKKLRLSKEQAAFLEESFKENSIPNPTQKMCLASRLSLRPRQVEVWFQNRRARTKLKQTEIDCEYLRKCQETLTEENRRLQKELNELRALKASKPFYMQRPATTLTMCPSCEKVAAAGASPVTPSASTFAGGKNHRDMKAQ